METSRRGVEALEKAGSGRQEAGNGFSASRQPKLGRTSGGSGAGGRTSRERAERGLKWQAGSFDPGMEALRGAAVAGERKVVTRVRSREERKLRRAGRR
jgi:hypothetical protein